MARGLQFVTSPRIAKLAGKLRDKSYRDSYVASHTRQFLARQMRSFRCDNSQTEFAELLGTSQSIVSSRYEDPNYGKWALQTLFDIASRLNVAVFVRFVDFPTFLKLSDDMSIHASRPESYSDDALKELTKEENQEQESSGLAAIFKSSADPKQITPPKPEQPKPAINSGPFFERQKIA